MYKPCEPQMNAMADTSNERYAGDLHPGWEDQRIVIPPALRKHRIDSLDMSERLANRLAAAAIERFGELHGLTYKYCRRFRNVGRKTLLELRAFVRRCQDEHGGIIPHIPPVILRVPEGLRKRRLDAMPLSGQLARVLQKGGYEVLGQLHGLNVEVIHQIEDGGRTAASELMQLLDRAEAGEFTRPYRRRSSPPLITTRP